MFDNAASWFVLHIVNTMPQKLFMYQPQLQYNGKGCLMSRDLLCSYVNRLLEAKRGQVIYIIFILK